MKQELQVFAPGLPNTPGWAALTSQKQEWLQQRTSNILQYRRAEAVAGIGECQELLAVEEGLRDEKMTLTNYIRAVYRNAERTAYRRLADYKELTKVLPAEVLDALAKDGSNLLQGSAGIGAKEILRAAKALPAPKSKEPKTIEGYITELRKTLREDRVQRRKGPLKLDAEEAMKSWITITRRLLRDAQVNKSAEQRAWLKTALGYLMEVRAISGTISTERIPIPDGWLPKRGAPRGKRHKKRT